MIFIFINVWVWLWLGEYVVMYNTWQMQMNNTKNSNEQIVMNCKIYVFKHASRTYIAHKCTWIFFVHLQSWRCVIGECFQQPVVQMLSRMSNHTIWVVLLFHNFTLKHFIFLGESLSMKISVYHSLPYPFIPSQPGWKGQLGFLSQPGFRDGEWWWRGRCNSPISSPTGKGEI